MIRFDAEAARRLSKAFEAPIGSEEFDKEKNRALRLIHAAVGRGEHSASIRKLQPETIRDLNQAGYHIEICSINCNYNIISW